MKLNGNATEVAERLRAHIDKAKQEFLSGATEQDGLNFVEELQKLQPKFEVWDNKSKTIITASFSEPSDLLQEYSPKDIFIGMVLEPTDPLEDYEKFKNRVIRKVEVLLGLIDRLDLYEERPIYRQSGAKLDGLHPEAIMAAGKLMKDGHFSQAVFETFKALEIYVANASGKKGLVGADLMQQVFSPKAPLIELSKHLEEQAGFMMLYAGAMKAIRNNHGHQKVSLNEQEAIEWLAFASALFRLVDKPSP